MDPSTLQDCIEGTYIAFRSRLRDITQATHCECNACVLIPRLDLKLVVHHGLVARQRMAGMEELVGADVILVHRLLKNEVVETTGVHAYALYTQAALVAAGIEPGGQGMLEHHETTDVAGDVTAWVRDLAAVWQAFLDRPRDEIPPEDVAGTWVIELPVPVSIAWEYITSPSLRPLWQLGVTDVIETSPDGRRGVGTTIHCMHGKVAVIERILAWQPPHYWLERSSLPESMGGIELLMSDELVELPEGGTRVTMRMSPADPTPERVAGVAAAADGWMAPMIDSLTATLTEVAARMAFEAADGPAVPLSEARHLTSPIRQTQGAGRAPATIGRQDHGEEAS
jgi:hypothetical protein